MEQEVASSCLGGVLRYGEAMHNLWRAERGPPHKLVWHHVLEKVEDTLRREGMVSAAGPCPYQPRITELRPEPWPAACLQV